ncbi:RICIN domain-containing protein [Streptomyces collinus]|uniref:RICIN domain-containing protein n=1 Tax=Streptomyces collinus TaxID=42684 RepID=UPI0033AB3DA3
MDGKAPHEPSLHTRRRHPHRRGRTRRRHRASRRRTGSPFRIETDAGGCLEIADASTHNGAPLQQYRCLGTDNQLFTTQDAGDGLVKIKTFAGKCLEVSDSDPSVDDSIVQGDCDDRYVFQEFQIHDVGDGTVEIEAHNTLYWTIEAGHPGLLAPIVLHGPSSLGHQAFTLVN